MIEERLNGLALMQIHPEIVPDIGKVIDKFAIVNIRLKFTFSRLYLTFRLIFCLIASICFCELAVFSTSLPGANYIHPNHPMIYDSIKTVLTNN